MSIIKINLSLTITYSAINVLGICEEVDFETLTFAASTTLNKINKFSINHFTRH